MIANIARLFTSTPGICCTDVLISTCTNIPPSFSAVLPFPLRTKHAGSLQMNRSHTSFIALDFFLDFQCASMHQPYSSSHFTCQALRDQPSLLALTSVLTEWCLSCSAALLETACAYSWVIALVMLVIYSEDKKFETSDTTKLKALSEKVGFGHAGTWNWDFIGRGTIHSSFNGFDYNLILSCGNL